MCACASGTRSRTLHAPTTASALNSCRLRLLYTVRQPHPLSLVSNVHCLWSVVCGVWCVLCVLCAVLCVLWCVCCGVCAVVCALWFVCCGRCAVCCVCDVVSLLFLRRPYWLGGSLAASAEEFLDAIKDVPNFHGMKCTPCPPCLCSVAVYAFLLAVLPAVLGGCARVSSCCATLLCGVVWLCGRWRCIQEQARVWATCAYRCSDTFRWPSLSPSPNTHHTSTAYTCALAWWCTDTTPDMFTFQQIKYSVNQTL